MRRYFTTLAMDLFSWVLIPIIRRRYSKYENALFDERVRTLELLEREARARMHFAPYPDVVMLQKFARHDYECAEAKEAFLVRWRFALVWCERSDAFWGYLHDLDDACIRATLRTIDFRVKAELTGLIIPATEETNDPGPLL